MSPGPPDPASKRRRGGPSQGELLAAKRLVSSAERRGIKEAEQLVRDARRMLEVASADAERRRTEGERLLAESRAEAERILAASRAEAERIRAEALEAARAMAHRAGDVRPAPVPGQQVRQPDSPDDDSPEDASHPAGTVSSGADEPGVEEAERLYQEARRLLEAAAADAERRRAEADRIRAESQAEADRLLTEAGRVLAEAQAEAERTRTDSSEAPHQAPAPDIVPEAEIADGSREALRCQAALEAGNLIADNSAVLRRLLQIDPSTEVRMAAVRALAHTSEFEQIGALGLALHDPEPAIRVEALKTLAVAKTSRSGNLVAAAASDDDAAVRAAARRRLVTATAATLWRALRPDRYRVELLAFVENAAPHRLAANVLAGLHSTHDTDRILALEVIGHLGTPMLLSQAVHTLTDPEPAVRRTAASVLRGHGAATPALLTALAEDPDPQVRREVGRSLADLGTEPVILALLGALNDPDAGVRGTAGEALRAHRSVALAGRTALVTTSTLDLVGKALSETGAEDRRTLRDLQAAHGDMPDRLPSAWPLGMAPRRAVTTLDVAGAALTASLLLVAALGVTGPGRILLALAFVSFVPGWAILGHLPVIDGTDRIALAVALSLTICTGVAQGLLWLRLWNPSAMLAVVGSICLAVLTMQLTRPRLGRTAYR